MIDIKIITIANQKGGVTKSTTAIHIAACLGEMGYKSVVLDCDPQANATVGLGIQLKDIKYGTADIFESKGEININEAILKTPYKNLHVIPADQSLAREEWLLWRNYEHNVLLILKTALRKLEDVSCLVIDTPPSMGVFPINSFMASDYVIVPITPDPYALIGISYLLSTIDDIRYNDNRKLKLVGFVKSKWDDRSRLAKEIGFELDRAFGKKVFNTEIRINVKIKEAATKGMPVINYDTNAPGSEYFRSLAREVEERCQLQKEKK